LINPLVIRRPSGATPILVAGAHRLAAVRDLGWKEVPCVSVPDQDADQAALVEIDENLVRNDLSPAERAIFISRRKEIYERLCPQAKHGGAPGKAGGGKVAKEPKFGSFAQETAKSTGRSKSSIKQDATRAKRIPQIAEVAGTSLDKSEELDALAKRPAAEQAELIARAKAGETVTAKAKPAASAPKLLPEQKLIELIGDTVFVPGTGLRTIHALNAAETLMAADYSRLRADYLEQLARHRMRAERERAA
jgi:ParB-like chromosome segregation protein Spo0J